MSLVLKVSYVSYRKTCPTTASRRLDGRHSPFGPFHRCSPVIGSHWEGGTILRLGHVCRAGPIWAGEFEHRWDSSDTRGHCLPGWWDGANCCQHIRLKLTSVVERKKKMMLTLSGWVCSNQQVATVMSPDGGVGLTRKCSFMLFL